MCGGAGEKPDLMARPHQHVRCPSARCTNVCVRGTAANNCRRHHFPQNYLSLQQGGNIALSLHSLQIGAEIYRVAWSPDVQAPG